MPKVRSFFSLADFILIPFGFKLTFIVVISEGFFIRLFVITRNIILLHIIDTIQSPYKSFERNTSNLSFVIIYTALTVFYYLTFTEHEN